MPNRNISDRESPPLPRNITGKRIQAVRRSQTPKVSQDDLSGRLAARGLTLTRTQIAKIENGKRPVFDYELFAIAKALRTPAESLFVPNLLT